MRPNFLHFSESSSKSDLTQNSLPAANSFIGLEGKLWELHIIYLSVRARHWTQAQHTFTRCQERSLFEESVLNQHAERNKSASHQLGAVRPTKPEWLGNQGISPKHKQSCRDRLPSRPLNCFVTRCAWLADARCADESQLWHIVQIATMTLRPDLSFIFRIKTNISRTKWPVSQFTAWFRFQSFHLNSNIFMPLLFDSITTYVGPFFKLKGKT